VLSGVEKVYSAQQALLPQWQDARASRNRQISAFDHFRALAQRVEVDTGEVRIMGSKSNLLQTLAAVRGLEQAGHGAQPCTEVVRPTGIEPVTPSLEVLWPADYGVSPDFLMYIKARKIRWYDRTERHKVTSAFLHRGC
jgi:hypothetical protein